MYINRTEYYNDKLYKKMQAELDQFIADWKSKSSADTVELAYELTYKEEILNSFDFDWKGRTPVPIEQAKALLAMKYPLLFSQNNHLLLHHYITGKGIRIVCENFSIITE